MNIPNITEARHWNKDAVRTACIRNGLYTCGSADDYRAMLGLVSLLAPTIENLYIVAKNVADHSEDQTVSNVMFILENQTVTTTFQVEE